jgi:hypothetical protein
VVCALLTYCGHMHAGGAAPDVGLLVVLGLLLAGFLVTLADRRHGPLAILTLVSAAQLALHGLLQLLGTDHAAMGTTDHSAVGTTQHAAMGTAPPGAPLEALLGAHPWAMLGAHALAVLVTAAMLAGAEDAVFAVAGAVARVLPAIPVLPRAPEPHQRVAMATAGPDSKLRRVLARRVCLRRGPPSSLATLAAAR